MIWPPCLWKHIKGVCKKFAQYVPIDDMLVYKYINE